MNFIVFSSSENFIGNSSRWHFSYFLLVKGGDTVSKRWEENFHVGILKKWKIFTHTFMSENFPKIFFYFLWKFSSHLSKCIKVWYILMHLFSYLAYFCVILETSLMLIISFFFKFIVNLALNCVYQFEFFHSQKSTCGDRSLPSWAFMLPFSTTLKRNFYSKDKTIK